MYRFVDALDKAGDARADFEHDPPNGLSMDEASLLSSFCYWPAEVSTVPLAEEAFVNDHDMTTRELVSEIEALRSRVEAVDRKGRASEAALFETEKLHRFLLERTSDAVVVHSEGRVVYVNAAAMALLGASHPREILQKAIADLFDPAPSGAGENGPTDAGDRGALAVGEKIRRLDGRMVEVDTAGNRVTFEGREAVQLVIRDRNKLRKIEEALGVKTSQLAAVTDAMTAFVETGDWQKASALILRNALNQTRSEYGFVGVVVHGPSLRVLAHEGIRWDEVLGRKLYEEALGMYEEKGYLEFTGLSNLFGRVITGKRAVVSNEPANDPRSSGLPRGHPPLRHFMGVPVFKATEVVGMIGIANRPGGYSGAELDKITILCRAVSVLYDSYRRRENEAALLLKEKEAEMALRQSEERLQLALEALKGGIWDWNVETDEVYFGPRWSLMLGYEPGEVEPHLRSWEERLHPDDKPAVFKRLNEHLEGRAPTYSSEHRMRTKSGEWIWVSDRGCVVARDADGRPLRMTGTDMDITDRKRAEEERQQLQAQVQHAQKLESLGVMAGGIAHDFNNLLTSILGHASLARTKISNESPLRHHVEQMETAGRRAAELSNQMLAYAGKGHFLSEAFCLSALVREMARLLEPVVSKRAALDYRLEDPLPSVEGDPSQIRQVVMNLVTNASEALGDKNGTITVQTGVMDVDRDYLSNTYLDDNLPEGRYVYFEVSDSGCGMDEATRKKLFDPFFTTKVAGRGLGLAATLGIIRKHHGAIRIDSRPGSGTTVRIVLPSGGAIDSEEAPTTENAAPRPLGGTVLVVDDEESVRSVTRNILEECGFAVLTAGDGLAAEEVFRKNLDTIRVVLLDLVMPGMSGEEVLQRIHALRRDTPVILLSGYAKEGLANGLAEGDVVGFLQKPFGVEELIGALNAIVRDR